jgi:hypothetical protein
MATPEPDQNCVFGCWGNGGQVSGKKEFDFRDLMNSRIMSNMEKVTDRSLLYSF